MPEKLRLAEINYHHHAEIDSAAAVIAKHRPANMILSGLQSRLDVTFVKHAAVEAKMEEQRTQYRIFRGKNSFFHLPHQAHKLLKIVNPSWVIVPGFIFPFQVLLLRKKLGPKCRIILQHQGDVPGGKKLRVQKIADRYINAYFFRSCGNAGPWMERGVIKNENKVHELPDASTWFTRQDKLISRKKTGIAGEPSFLWVGRMDDNKDPFTVLDAFELYAVNHQAARLYMITAGGPLRFAVQSRIEGSAVLRERVVLVGEVDHEAMPAWYSAADYFILSSHREGGSYALTEAMACGCVPIVSAISPSLQAINHGKAGISFKAGDHQSLVSVLNDIDAEDPYFSNRVIHHFNAELSAHAAANRLYDVLMSIHTKQ